MNELECTWDELKRRAKEFLDYLPTVKTADELNGLWDGFVSGYTNLEALDHERHQASLLLQILCRKRLWREVEMGIA